MEKLTHVNVLIPIQAVSEANAREHWRVKAKRVREQKDWVALKLLEISPKASFQLPAEVSFTRYGIRDLDSDNLAGSFKAIRDAVALWLGCGDGPSDPVVWLYAQLPLKKVTSLALSNKGWKFAIQIEIKCQ